MNLKSKFYRDTKVSITKTPYNKTMDDRKIKSALRNIVRCPKCSSIMIKYSYTYIEKSNVPFVDKIRNLDNHIITCACSTCDTKYEICIKINHEYGPIEVLDDYMNFIKNEILSKGVIDAF